MNPAFSLYLDAVRFLAAVLVVLYHTNQRWLIDMPLPMADYGHSAVVVFFVLSGYVISHVTARKDGDLRSFVVDRATRIYSVALPAVLLTPLLDMAGKALHPAAYDGLAPDDWWPVRVLASLSFTNELWTVSILSFSNTPYWSLCYEVWYYAAFAVWSFVSGRRRWLLLAGCALVAGIKILLLAPIWWMGVVLYRSTVLEALAQRWRGWPLALLSAAGIVLMHAHGVQEQASGLLQSWIGDHWHAQLFLSKFFLSDLLLGILVMLHFAGVRALCECHGLRLGTVAGSVRGVAAYTFTLYLFHQPLFLFWGAVLRGDPADWRYYAFTMMFLILSVHVIGAFTEKRRHVLRPAVERSLGWLPFVAAGKPAAS